MTSNSANLDFSIYAWAIGGKYSHPRDSLSIGACFSTATLANRPSHAHVVPSRFDRMEPSSCEHT